MDIETLKAWMQGVHMIVTFGLGAWLYVEKRNDKTNDRVTELANKVEQLDKDMAGLQATSESAPNHADLGRVHESINKLSATVNQLVGENRGQSDTLRMILNKITEKGMQ